MNTKDVLPVLTFIVSLVALARQLGDYKNTTMAKWVVDTAGVVLLASLGFLIYRFAKALRQRRSGKMLKSVRHEIRHDYLPRSPLDNGWIKAYGDATPSFEADIRINESLKMTVPGKFAMDYYLPADAEAADNIQFEAIFGDGAIFYADVEVGSKDGQHSERLYFAHVLGNQAPTWFPQWREWKFFVVPSRYAFSINLGEEVKRTVASRGLTFRKLKGIRLRGNITISPIRFH